MYFELKILRGEFFQNYGIDKHQLTIITCMDIKYHLWPNGLIV